MNDYYSNFPAPSLSVCKDEVKNSLNYDKITDDMLSNAFVASGVDECGEVKYSYTGWYVFGKNEVLKTLNSMNKFT